MEGVDVSGPGGFDTVLVVDFGAQYAQLIARRVRECHGCTREIVPSTACRSAEMLAKKPEGDHPVRRPRPPSTPRARRHIAVPNSSRAGRADLRNLLRATRRWPGRSAAWSSKTNTARVRRAPRLTVRATPNRAGCWHGNGRVAAQRVDVARRHLDRGRRARGLHRDGGDRRPRPWRRSRTTSSSLYGVQYHPGSAAHSSPGTRRYWRTVPLPGRGDARPNVDDGQHRRRAGRDRIRERGRHQAA